jgi:hypothetical protein
VSAWLGLVLGPASAACTGGADDGLPYHCIEVETEEGEGDGGDDRDDGGDASAGSAAAGAALSSAAAYPSSGSVAVTLHPGPTAVIGDPTVVSFGAPFPPGALADGEAVRAFDAAGDQLRIHSAELLSWRVWPGRTDARPSVRAAMISVEVTFPSAEPLPIRLDYGARPDPDQVLPPPDDRLAGWADATDGEYPDGDVREPPVYAGFPPEWLGDCQLQTRTTPAGSDPAWAWLDDSLVASARTAVNQTPADQPIPIASDPEPWLFDRAATLFGVYVRTGDVTWLRHAHRAARFYASHVDDAGYFDLAGSPDLKYSYGRSLLIDYILTGDPEALAAVERVAAAGAQWDASYDLGRPFWTERHQTYALLAELVAWEGTGELEHADRACHVAETSFQLAAEPVGSWSADGCMLHTMNAHEGAGGDEPVCSPWMSALFADAVWAYYVHTEDRAALGFLAGLGRFVADVGLYAGGDGVAYTLPWYLASSTKTFSDDGPWGDVEHTCDVAGLVARAAWAEKRQGGDPRPLRAVADKLLQGCAWNLDRYAAAAPDGALRLSPPRKFNWWFGTLSDLPWLMGETE